MSRRPVNSNADRAAQNQQTLKALVKVESNKSCADCKRNKHPRWASWNLGIFVCIRCSGIHRGMGTHISRVKSVDLDAWTDEQLQNMLRWGNSRANKYWEAKLAPGHVPAEAKIENFIRTKYDSKRWVMDGGMPDPATLDTAADDDVPLNIVQEKAKLERSASLRTSSAPIQPPQAPPKKANPDIDLFGDDTSSTNTVPTRNGPSNISQTTTARAPPPPQQRQARNGGDSLLGFDFFGGGQSNVPARPSSAAAAMSGSAGSSRPDLKQSILSLYASGSRTAATPTQPSSQTRQTPGNQSSSLGGLDNDFAGLNFSPPANPQAPATSGDVFSNLASPSSGRTAPATSMKSPPITSPPVQSPPSQNFGGGGFFDAKPSIPAQPVQAPTAARPNAQRGFSASSGFGDFESATSPIAAPVPTPIQNRAPVPVNTSSNGLGDMFDFSAPSPLTSKAPPPTQPAPDMSSPFNLSNPTSPTKHTTQPSMQPANRSSALSMDPWGSNDAWASAGPVTTASSIPTPPMKSTKAPATISSPTADWGWNGGGSSANNSTSFNGSANSTAKSAQVAPDEDFGGWESSTFQAPAVPLNKPQPAPPKPSGGFASNDNDLFSNVWE